MMSVALCSCASRAHLGVLADRLRHEVEARGCTRELTPAFAALDRALAGGSFDLGLAAYLAAAHEKAALLNRRAEVAASYPSMEDFWRDAVAQERGESSRGYWDSYEHGWRRQLEHRLAASYGSEAALLVNTGMSALDAAVGSLGLRPGDGLVIPARAYFETEEYVDGVLAPRGVEIIRVDTADEGALLGAVERPRVRAVVVETAANGIPCDVVAPLKRVLPTGCALVIDNSMLSHGVRWFELLPPGPVLVVESAIKYLSGTCTAGVVYGRLDMVEPARRYARRVGQQLQERAFNHLQVGELEEAAARVVLHSRRAELFRRALDPRKWAVIDYAGAGLGSRADDVAVALSASGPGAVLFLRLPGPDDVVAARHRLLLRRWAKRSPGPSIRAGFGWPRTSVRAYESTALNRADAPLYVRVSVGLEPEDVVAELAGSLDAAAGEVIS
jgi:cystathionine beta-lyase/cystathionine gamma-synthase